MHNANPRVAYLVVLLSGVSLMMCVQRTIAKCEGTVPLTTRFDAGRISEHVRVLASDEFEGRSPASKGEAKTIAYISKQFAAVGLKPAGDNESWTQAVPLRKFEMGEAAMFRIKVGGSVYEPKYGDAAVVTSLAGEKRIAIEDAPMIFVGYGVTAPELGWDDFKGADLKGKVVIFLINDPDFDSAVPGKFGGRAMTYYGRWMYKFEEAARRGAAAALIVHEDAPAGYGWATVQNSWSAPQFDIVRPDPRKSHPLIEGWLRRDAALHLFQLAGLDFDGLKKRAIRPDFAPVELKNTGISVRANISVERLVSHNVIAKLSGQTRADESVIYSAHWDHLGMGRPDSTGDRIYNGAGDNATGVAGLLELARVFASHPPSSRSIYFAAFTAEEKGLLGSEYYVLHPPAALEHTAAVFNMDLFAVSGPACDISISGSQMSSLEDLLAAMAARQGRAMAPDAHLEAGYFYRSDHFPFAKRGVPALRIVSGETLYQGGVAAGRKAAEEYITQRYHQPADEWSPNWDLSGVAIDLDLLYEAGRSIANSTTWPQWLAGSEFKRIRDQSDHLRNH